ncbi:hypothetical protein TB2_029529 [Malus domestica]
MAFPDDLDDVHDWLVIVNDEALERFDSSMDEFKIVRKEAEEAKRPTSAAMDIDDGFQLVCRKKKKGPTGSIAASGNDDSSQVSSAMKVAAKDKKTVWCMGFRYMGFLRPPCLVQVLDFLMGS